MIVGFTAFIFKIVFGTTKFVPDEYYLSLEFADILVPLFSFCNCFIGIFLILISELSVILYIFFSEAQQVNANMPRYSKIYPKVISRTDLKTN